jgi:hypothetical protein
MLNSLATIEAWICGEILTDILDLASGDTENMHPMHSCQRPL